MSHLKSFHLTIFRGVGQLGLCVHDFLTDVVELGEDSSFNKTGLRRLRYSRRVCELVAIFESSVRGWTVLLGVS